MTTEPEALRLARDLVAQWEREWPDLATPAAGYELARALISAEAVVAVVRLRTFEHQRRGYVCHCRLCAALRTHDAALSPASTRPADVSMDERKETD